MHVQGEWWVGHGDLLQIEKETLSFKELHGYFQKGKKKMIVMIEQVFLTSRWVGEAG